LETPFRLTYGYDAVIPIKLNLPSSRMQSFDHDRNDEEMRFELDTLEEAREIAKIRQASAKARTTRLVIDYPHIVHSKRHPNPKGELVLMNYISYLLLLDVRLLILDLTIILNCVMKFMYF
jgi:hypothetical protein